MATIICREEDEYRVDEFLAKHRFNYRYQEYFDKYEHEWYARFTIDIESDREERLYEKLRSDIL